MPHLMRYLEVPLGLSRLGCWWTGIIVYVSVTIAVAIASYHLIELPTIAIGRQARCWLRDGYDNGIWIMLSNLLPRPWFTAIVNHQSKLDQAGLSAKSV
jgi:peptidoglycan/LPS O-acetylase OafA/YrhL